MVFSPVILIAIVAVILFVSLGVVFARLYRKASKETSYVRTGLGGQKVILNGGTLVLPVVHEVIPVNMKTLRLAVHRANDQALITRDKMRVDVIAEFYVRVKPTAEAIAAAAQTLGSRTMEPEALKDLIEGKFVDALRSVAAEMAMTELHEQRVEFVHKVQTVVAEDLNKNGLELETVSLTGLDQTSKDYFNPDNAFDAEGLTKLTESIEERRKRRNEIEQETLVEIQQKNMEATQRRLKIEREQEYARLEQEREVEIRRASQAAEIAKEKAERNKEAERAQILANQEIEQTRLASEQALQNERIQIEQNVRSKEIEKEKALEEARITKEKSVEIQEIDRRKQIELSQQIREIAIAEKSKEQSEASAQASIARGQAVKEEERVTTLKQIEIAERQKQIDLVEATKEAEKDAISIKVSAEAEKQAAKDLAEAKEIAAKGTAHQLTIEADAKAKAKIVETEANEKAYAVEAEGKRLLNEAENLISADLIQLKVKTALIDKMPEIIRESAKPMEKIDSIKIMQVDGFGKEGNKGKNNTQNDGSLSDQVVNSALRYRAQAPLVDNLMNELGIQGGNLRDLTKPLDK